MWQWYFLYSFIDHSRDSNFSDIKNILAFINYWSAMNFLHCNKIYITCEGLGMKDYFRESKGITEYLRIWKPNNAFITFIRKLIRGNITMNLRINFKFTLLINSNPTIKDLVKSSFKALTFLCSFTSKQFLSAILDSFKNYIFKLRSFKPKFATIYTNLRF